MALNKENLAKVLQTVSKKGVAGQPSEEAVESGSESKALKDKIRKRKKKKPKSKDEEVTEPTNTSGSW